MTLLRFQEGHDRSAHNLAYDLRGIYSVALRGRFWLLLRVLASPIIGAIAVVSNC